MNVVCMLCLMLFPTILSAQPVPGSTHAPFTSGNYTDDILKGIEFFAGDVREGRALGLWGEIGAVRFQSLLGLQLSNAGVPLTWNSGNEFGSIRTQTK